MEDELFDDFDRAHPIGGPLLNILVGVAWVAFAVWQSTKTWLFPDVAWGKGDGYSMNDIVFGAVAAIGGIWILVNLGGLVVALVGRTRPHPDRAPSRAPRSSSPARAPTSSTPSHESTSSHQYHCGWLPDGRGATFTVIYHSKDRVDIRPSKADPGLLPSENVGYDMRAFLDLATAVGLGDLEAKLPPHAEGITIPPGAWTPPLPSSSTPKQAFIPESALRPPSYHCGWGSQGLGATFYVDYQSETPRISWTLDPGVKDDYTHMMECESLHTVLARAIGAEVIFKTAFAPESPTWTPPLPSPPPRPHEASPSAPPS